MADKKATTGISCVHCGDDCGKSPIMFEDKPFCCSGCVSVYRILHENDLSDYYSLENNPGIKMPQAVAESRFAYLDDPETTRRLVDFDDGRTARMTFSIPQMHCASCIWLLENLYVLNKAVTGSQVDFPRKELSVTWRSKLLSLRQLVELLASIGYEPDIRMADLEAAPRDRSIRRLYAQLAVAGFCFGNIMLLSFPEYLGLDNLLETSFMKAFNYLNFALALPVLFFSGIDYFRSAITGLRQKQINMDVPISLGVAILFLRSSLDILWFHQAGYMDSLAGLVFFLLVGRLYQTKTYSALSFDRDYRSYLPIAVVRKQADGEVNVPVDSLAVGDRIVIRNRELIPADAVLISGHGNIDYSFVTGESDPVPAESGERLYAGGRQMGSAIELDVIKEPSQSYLMQLWTQAGQAVSLQPHITNLANRVSAWFTPAILLVAIAAGIFWWASDPSRALNAVSAVLIIACPCALALSTPFTLGTILRILGRNDFYLKETGVVERLAGVDSVVFDKTGTLTQTDVTEPVFEGDPLTEQERQVVYSTVRHSTHPMSTMIARALGSHSPVAIEDFSEVTGKGLTARVQGAEIRVGSASWVGETSDQRQVGSSRVYVAIDGTVRGYYRVANAMREGLSGLMESLRGRVRLSLLSGDKDSDRERIVSLLGPEADIHFSQKPADKLAYINEKVVAGERVLMVGDGLNDAGALQAATVGVSVAEKESSFSPASDGILRSNGLIRLGEFIALSRSGVTIIKVSFALSFLYNIIGMYIAVQGTLSPVIAAILMPASSVSVVLFTTIMSTIRARRMGLV